ncbi:MAG: OsmC family protein [Fidelibacterota bacterium]
MAVRKGTAVWHGNLREGEGRVRTETGVLDAPYSFTSRFEDGEGTNPEELMGAAHAGCFSMALSSNLEKEGYTAERISTQDRVFIERVGEGFGITRIEVSTEAVVPGIDDETFQTLAEGAKNNCPVSKALAAVDMVLHATLKEG